MCSLHCKVWSRYCIKKIGIIVAAIITGSLCLIDPTFRVRYRYEARVQKKTVYYTAYDCCSGWSLDSSGKYCSIRESNCSLRHPSICFIYVLYTLTTDVDPTFIRNVSSTLLRRRYMTPKQRRYTI